MHGRGGDPGWVVALSAIGLLAFFGGIIFAAGKFAYLVPRPLTLEERIERSLLYDSRSGEIARTIKANFPEEFTGLKRSLLTLRYDASEDEIRLVTGSFSTQAALRHRLQVLEAPRGPFLAYRNAELAMLERLGTVAPDQCASYVSQGRANEQFDEQARKAQVAQQVTFWKAAAAGRDNPVTRLNLAARPADNQLFVAALRKEGMAESDFNLWGSGRLALAPAAAQCKIGLYIMRALAHMPEEAGDRVYIRVTNNE